MYPKEDWFVLCVRKRWTMTINSRDKGARGERELASKLREYGYEARRGQQYSGIEGEDVIGLDQIHIECKRVERLQLTDAMLQSCRDAKENEIPVVMHRKNREDWYVTMKLDDWMKLYKGEIVWTQYLKEW
jgi:Holliday junction resolvase